MPLSLTEIANHYGTDKGTIGPSRDWEGHNYTDIYQAYLERHRHDSIFLLEIGLGVVGDRWPTAIAHGRNTGGASLKMWYDYFPNARIFGIDINSCAYLDNDRIKTFVVDQGDVNQLKAFIESIGVPQFDVIIDDGSHRPDHQQISLSYFIRYLKPGGLYFIEDLLDNGHGDRAAGQHCCDSVLNTRSVLKSFAAKGGAFPEPNAITDAGYLVDHVESVSFHVPQRSARLGLGTSFRHPLRGVFGYREGKEQLCALRKS